MANRTVKDANTIKGTNPQYLIEKITRSRIYESKFWKEECFALSAELLVDKAMELKYVGGVYGGNIKPTPFLCLVLKMLQIQPEKDIIVEFIRNPDFKYVRALGALYMRLTGTSLDVYKYLEPLYNDYRKIKRQNVSGEFELLHMDELIDELLREERVCDIILPRIQKRMVLEESNILDQRVSALDDDLEDGDMSDDEDLLKEDGRHSPSPERNQKDKPRRSASPKRRRSKSRSPNRRRRSRSKERDRSGRERHRSRSRERRHRSRSPHEHRHSKHGDDDRKRHHKSKKSKHEHRDKDDHRSKDKDRSKSTRDKHSNLDPEIAEANAIRKKLGLAPLQL